MVLSGVFHFFFIYFLCISSYTLKNNNENKKLYIQLYLILNNTFILSIFSVFDLFYYKFFVGWTKKSLFSPLLLLELYKKDKNIFHSFICFVCCHLELIFILSIIFFKADENEYFLSILTNNFKFFWK